MRERGVRFGRPRKLTPDQREEALRQLAAGETQADVARSYNDNRPLAMIAISAGSALEGERAEQCGSASRLLKIAVFQLLRGSPVQHLAVGVEPDRS